MIFLICYIFSRYISLRSPKVETPRSFDLSESPCVCASGVTVSIESKYRENSEIDTITPDKEVLRNLAVR